MSRFAFLCVFVACAGMAGVRAYAQPVCSISTRSADLGRVEMGQQAKARFPLINHGSAPLTIKLAKKSCGCLILDVPPTVPPGKEAEIVIAQEVSAPSEIVAHATVETNDPVRPVLELEMRFRGVQPIFVEPSSVEITAESQSLVETALALRAADGKKPFRLLEMKCTVPWLAPAPRGDSGDKPAAAHDLRFSGVAPLQGKVEGAIRLRTDSVAVPSIEVPVDITVTGPYVLEPAQLRLGVSAAGACLAGEVLVERTDGLPFRLAAQSQEGLTLAVAPPEGSTQSDSAGASTRWEVEVSVTAPERRGPWRKTITLTGTDEQGTAISASFDAVGLVLRAAKTKTEPALENEK